PSFKEKPPPRTAEKATRATGHRNSPGDNPMTRVAVATTATAVRGAGGGTTRPQSKTSVKPGHDVVDWLHGRKDMAHGATTITCNDPNPLRRVGRNVIIMVSYQSIIKA
ncbi:hypothetical protein Tco_0248913, partial [Tanacetum coccineum]